MDRRTANIIVVDAHAGWRQGLQRFLQERFGLTVDEAGSAEEARRALVQAQPQVVLLDLNLADGESLQLGEQIRLWLPEASIIALSTYDWPEYRLAAERLGAVGFVVKERLVEELSAVLGETMKPGSASLLTAATAGPSRAPQSLLQQLGTVAIDLHLSYRNATFAERQRIWALLAANCGMVNVLGLLSHIH